MEDAAGRLTAVRAGRGAAGALLRRRGGARCGRRSAARVLAHGARPHSSTPGEPLTADRVGPGQGRCVSLTPRSGGLPPSGLSVGLLHRPDTNKEVFLVKRNIVHTFCHIPKSATVFQIQFTLLNPPRRISVVCF